MESEHCVVNPKIFGIVWQLLRPLVVRDQLPVKTGEPEAQRGEEGGKAPEVVSILSDVLDEVSGYDHRKVLGKDKSWNRARLVMVATDTVEITPPQI